VSHDQWLFRIDDMLSAIADIESHASDLDRERFTEDRLRQQAILWNFQVLGEAIQHIPESLRDEHPGLRWQLIRRTRNIIVHHYEKISLDIIWDAMEKDIPALRRELETMKRDLGQP